MNDNGSKNTGRDAPTNNQRRGSNQPYSSAASSPQQSIDLAGVCFTEKPAAGLFDTVAQRAAETVAEAPREENKASQLRRFYDELVMWQAKVGKDEAAFRDAEPYIRMLKAKVAYSKGRGHIDENFRRLFSHVIDQATSVMALRQAKLFMEAFMAFYKVYRQK
jgi:CRISPR-associated protein Csm2